MIKILKDISKEYISNTEHVIVKNLESYFEARKQFFINYKLNKDFEIVIKNKKYFNFFLDFQNYEGIKSEEITEIVEPKIDLGSTQNIFGALLNGLNSTQNSKKIMQALEREYLKNYSFLFQNRDLKIKDIIYSLLKIVVFSKYKECNFNILMDSGYSDEMYKIGKNDVTLKSSFEIEKSNLSEYTEKCNHDLEKNSKKMQLFTEFPNTKYLEQINGELAFEKEYFLKMNIERLNQLQNYDEILENFSKAETVFRESYSDIIELIGSLITLDKTKIKEKVTLEDFIEYFTTIYTEYNSISESKNLNSSIEKLEKKYHVSLSSLKQSIKNIWSSENKKFEEFYLKNYNNLYSSSEQRGLDYAIQNSYNALNSEKTTIYIFIDCLRYDTWTILKQYIEKKGYTLHYDKIVLSGIPTVTSYCKKMLYTGKKYNQIESQDTFKTDVKKLSSIDEFQDLDNSSDYLYEIIDLDNFFHSIKDLTDEYLQNSIELKLNKLFSSIDVEKFNIVVMTDHGAMKLYDDGFESFSKYKSILNDNELLTENHGRYIKIYSTDYRDNLYNEMKDYLGKDDNFYIIDREEMNRYYLPIAEKGKENYFYCIYKYGKYPKKTGEYNHGGISFEEVFIPYGVFKTEKKEYTEIQLVINSKEIRNSSKAELDILLENKNSIQKLKLKLKYGGTEIEYFDINANRKILMPLNLHENKEGEHRDILEVEVLVDGKTYCFEQSIVVEILKSKKAAINKKVKSSRSLL
ncbi:MAG: hypothetical protein ACRC5F_06470 [Cetobacterium sp.]